MQENTKFLRRLAARFLLALPQPCACHIPTDELIEIASALDAKSIISCICPHVVIRLKYYHY